MLDKFYKWLLPVAFVVMAVLFAPMALAAPADPIFEDISLAIPAGTVFSVLLQFGGTILVTSLVLAVGFVLTRRLVWRSTSGI